METSDARDKMRKKSIKEILDNAKIMNVIETRSLGVMLDKDNPPYLLFVSMNTPVCSYTKVYLTSKEFGSIIGNEVMSLKDFALGGSKVHSRLYELIAEDVDTPPLFQYYNADNVVVEVLAMSVLDELATDILYMLGQARIDISDYAIKKSSEIAYGGDDNPFALLFNLVADDDEGSTKIKTNKDKKVDNIVEDVMYS